MPLLLVALSECWDQETVRAGKAEEQKGRGAHSPDLSAAREPKPRLLRKAPRWAGLAAAEPSGVPPRRALGAYLQIWGAVRVEAREFSRLALACDDKTPILLCWTTTFEL